MRGDILKLVASEKDVTNAIVLTHNIDFVFLQSVVLDSLRKCGHPSLTVFADAAQATRSYSHQGAVLSSLGSRYRVVAVPSPPGFCFHPKAVLLSGPEKAALFIGSGNLTFGGWRENAELWARFDSDRGDGARFAGFREYLLRVVGLLPIPESVRAEVEEAFDPGNKTWARDLPASEGVLGKAGAGPPLIDRIVEALGAAPIDRLTVCSPYFDAEANALRALAERCGADSTRLLVQPHRTGLSEKAAANLRDVVEINPHDFRRESADEDRSAFIHSKFYAFERGDVVELFVGSANCSRAALTIPGSPGNAELLTRVTMSRSAFEEDVVDELTPVDPDLLVLSETDEQTSGPENSQPGVHLLAASYDYGTLVVAYRASSPFTPTRCEVDGEAYPFETRDADRISVALPQPPARVRLFGSTETDTIQSLCLWVDHEQALRSTARARSLARAVRDGVRPAVWSIDAWAEVAAVFGKHLRYTPTRVLSHRRLAPRGDAKQEEPIRFSLDDVFPAQYRIPVHHHPADHITEDGLTRSLQQLLLRWFGLNTDEGDTPDHTEDEPDVSPGPDDGDEDAVDRPERLPTRQPKARTKKEISESDRRRARRLLEAVSDALTSNEFLRTRPPSLMRSDLALASAILRSALREGWIDRADFFAQTVRVWIPLFFVSDDDPTRGWIDSRYRSAEEPELFQEEMTSPELAAALVGWYVAAPADLQTPDQAVFSLAAALAVARLPWLWCHEPTSTAEELSKLLTATEPSHELTAERWSDTERRWQDLLRDGQALHAIGSFLETTSLAELRPQITQNSVCAGELLWQGKLGFCVALCDAFRDDKHNVEVRYLQTLGRQPFIRGSYTIPVRSLLDLPVPGLDHGSRQSLADHLKRYTSRLSTGFLGVG